MKTYINSVKVFLGAIQFGLLLVAYTFIGKDNRFPIEVFSIQTNVVEFSAIIFIFVGFTGVALSTLIAYLASSPCKA